MEDNSKINPEEFGSSAEVDTESQVVNTDIVKKAEDDAPSDEEKAPLENDAQETTENVSRTPDEGVNISEDSEGFPEYSNVKELSDEEILNGKDFDFSNIEKIREQIEQNMPAEFAELLKDDDEEDNDSVVKKYNVYISKDFVPYIDNLSTNELSAYINDAIQKKIDLEDAERSGERKQRILGHFIVAVMTAIILTPVLLYTAHRSITATLNNYKYSQDNFEKLYAEKFKKSSVYTRSLKYNKLHQID